MALEKLLRSRPGHPEASRELVLLEIRSARFDEAKKALAELNQYHPGNSAVAELTAALRLATEDRLRLATARRLYETRRYDEAAQAMRELFPQGPPPGDYGLEYWDVIARSAGGKAEARAGLQALAQQFPDDSRYTVALEPLLERPVPPVQQRVAKPSAPERVAKLRARADVALEAGQSAEALRLLIQAVELEPAYAWARFDLARVYQKLDKNWHAHALMDEGLRRAPADSEMRYAAALVYASLDDDAAAQSALAGIPAAARTNNTRDLAQRLATKLQPPAVAPPNRIPVLRTEADAALAAGRTGQALRILEEAVALDPAYAWSRFDLAKAYQKIRRMQDARAIMDDGVKRAPADAEMRYAAALLYASLDDEVAALAMLAAIPASGQTDKSRELALRLTTKPQPPPDAPPPNRTAELRTKADAALADGQIEPALRFLLEAVNLDPTFAWVRFDLAKLYQRIERTARCAGRNGRGLEARASRRRYALCRSLAVFKSG